MKAVILAAGKGTRMGELTKTTPKHLLSIHGKNLIEYKLDVLPDEIDEVIIIIHYLGDMIRNYFGSKYGDVYNGKKITYFDCETHGSGYAVWQAKDLLTERFMVLNGDDLYARKDIEECLKHPQSILLYKSPKPISGGKVTVDENGYIEDIVEGPHEAGTVTAAGLYVLKPDVFNLPLVPAAKGKSEFGLPQTLLQLKDEKLFALYATTWFQGNSPGDLEISEEDLAKLG